MAESAYNLEHFAPSRKAEKPRVKVAKRKVSQRHLHRMKMVKTMLTVMLVVVLVFGVLYTHTTAAELQKEITVQEKQLKDEMALSAFLNNELENLSNLKYIEERAKQLGMQKVDHQRVTYIHVNDDNEIIIKESGFAEILEDARSGLLSVWDYVSP